MFPPFPLTPAYIPVLLLNQFAQSTASVYNAMEPVIRPAIVSAIEAIESQITSALRNTLDAAKSVPSRTFEVARSVPTMYFPAGQSWKMAVTKIFSTYVSARVAKKEIYEPVAGVIWKNKASNISTPKTEMLPGQLANTQTTTLWGRISGEAGQAVGIIAGHAGASAGEIINAACVVGTPAAKNFGEQLAKKVAPETARKFQKINNLYHFVSSIKSQHLIAGGIVAGITGYGVYRFFNPKTPANRPAAPARVSDAAAEASAKQDQINAVLIQEVQNTRSDLEALKALQHQTTAAQPIHFHYHKGGSKSNTDFDTREDTESTDLKPSVAKNTPPNIQQGDM